MPYSNRASALLALQQTHGNHYVQRVVTGIQAKLKVGQPGDKYEQEADRVADAVMRMPKPQVQRQPEEEEELQAKELPGQTSEVTPNLEARINNLRGGGQSLPATTRAFFEPRFDQDFSQVRIHADSEAAETVQALKARAFTVGQDIVFGAGEYAPKSTAGKRLLAHELTHVLQQGNRSGTLSETLIQRHNLEAGCDTPDTCGRLRRTLLELVSGVQRNNGQSWVSAIGPIREFINGLSAEETLSLRTMLGEIGRNPDTDLRQEVDEHLWPLWRSRMIAMLRTRTAAARVESATEEEEWEEEEAQPETGSRFLELPGEPLRGTSQPTQLRQVGSGGITIRINDVSGNWQIVGIERDWRGVVTLSVRNRRTRRVHGWSLQDWHVQRSITHVRQSTEAMADIAEAEVRILYELALPAWIRVPGEMAWMAFVCHQHREELERLVRDIGQFNPTLEWLHQHAPMSMQVFLVRRFALRVGQGMPQAMNPVQIGREIGRTLRNIRTLIRVIIAITRAARGSVAGVSSSILAFLGHGGRVLGSEALANGIAIIQNFRGLMRGISGLQSVGSVIQPEVRGRIADLLRSEGITLENRQIDQIIQENSSEETGQRMIQVLDALRNFVELSTALADEIDFQRPSPPPRSE